MLFDGFLPSGNILPIGSFFDMKPFYSLQNQPDANSTEKELLVVYGDIKTFFR